MFVRVFIHESSCEFAPSLRSPLISSIITPMINSWIYHKNKDSTFIMMHHLSPFLLCCMPIFRFAWKSDCTLLWTTMIQCWTLLCELFSNQVEKIHLLAFFIITFHIHLVICMCVCGHTRRCVMYVYIYIYILSEKILALGRGFIFFLFFFIQNPFGFNVCCSDFVPSFCLKGQLCL